MVCLCIPDGMILFSALLQEIIFITLYLNEPVPGKLTCAAITIK
jgi:hypothetical protein